MTPSSMTGQPERRSQAQPQDLSCKAGDGATVGNSRKLFEAGYVPMPVLRQGPAPDGNQTGGIQPAHQRWSTDVQRSRLLLCTPASLPLPTHSGGRKSAATALDGGHQRVSAARSRRGNSVGRARGVGGRRSAMEISLRTVTGADADCRSVAVIRCVWTRSDGPAWRARAGHWRRLGHGGSHRRLRGQRRPVACRSTRERYGRASDECVADYGPMACPRASVRMKISRPW
jgi:hypothetical protein